MAARTSSEDAGRTADGLPVQRWTLASDGGLVARVLTLGGIVQSLEVPDRDGRARSVVLGLPAPADYAGPGRYMGALIGRYGNRLGGGRFVLDGTEHRVPANDGPNALHGGPGGFHSRVWDARPVDAAAPGAAALELTLVSPDGDQGFPGELSVRVVYEVGPSTWSVRYEATTSAPTVVNLTSHSYFALGGEGSGSVEDQLLRIPASRVTEVAEGLVPTGRLLDVEGTPLDLRAPTRVGAGLRDPHPQLLLGLGYDHDWVLDEPSDGEDLALAAELDDPASGRRMQVWSTEPDVQFHSGNFLDGGLVGIGGGTYRQGDGLCLETQHAPDSPNHPDRPSTVLRPGETYRSRTEHRFSTLP
ncbi:aldose epimerase family protein [Vallicoccus soli]|uniref:Aldose 1-epimerase n=1 Tax=Vallicoccus soli TaxID=2339232 RepID=A0A3A3Z602_9ACTN|nr:aldose epimerase family protein [Vallicoccus soli]RJK97138.1 galactose mutarotase [Vallicoccus soli]